LRLLLEEHKPEIVYIKGIHNTITNAISRLEYDPSVNQTAESYFMTKVNKSSKDSQRQNWMAVSKHLCELELDTNKCEELNLVFANHGEDNEMLLMRKRLHCCQASIVALVAHCLDGIVALGVMVSSPSMCRRLCRFHNGNCCSCHNDVVAIVNVQASPPLLN
jgi:hypothetical protein